MVGSAYLFAVVLVSLDVWAEPDGACVERRVRERAAARVKQIRQMPNRQIPVDAICYYVSDKGDDAADGRTPRTAWRSPDRQNRATISPGSFVLFERGGIYRGQVNCKPGVTYTAYGEGRKPRIYASPFNGADPNRWQKTDTVNVWSIDMGHVDVGTVVFNEGAAHAVKVICRTDKSTGRKFDLRTGLPFGSFRDLEDDLHFWHDYYKDGTGKLYLFSAENPGTRFSSIEFNVRLCAFWIDGDNVTVDNFEGRYCGINGVAAPTRSDLTVSNCEFAWIGGGIQSEHLFGLDHPTRQGNAVEIYGGCDGYTVTNCYIHQVYDAGISHQVMLQPSQGMTPLDQKNIRYADNVIENCQYSIEYFLYIPKAIEGNPSRMENVLFENNIMLDAGYGFCEQRPDRGWGMHIKSWPAHQGNRATNFVVRNNILCGGRDLLCQMNHNLRNPDGTSSFPKVEGNVFVGERGRPFGSIADDDTHNRAKFDESIQTMLDGFGVGNRCVFTR